MLGLGTNNSNLNLQAIGNFIVVFLVQMLFELYDLLALERFPTEWELYRITIVSLVATVVFYGYNRLTKPPQEIT